MPIRLTNAQAKKYLKTILSNSKNTSAVCSDDTINEVYKQAMETLRYLQSLNSDLLHRGDVGIKIVLPEKTRGDTDNYAKGIIDGLQGIIFENDKQVCDIRVYRRGNLFEELD